MKSPIEKLEALDARGWKFGLGTTRALMERLGNPHRDLHFLHVAGTNGKGATCAFLASLLISQGYRTGLYTSPHLSHVRERFRVDGEWIPLSALNRLAGPVLAACGRLPRGMKPTYFEALTALAALWFKERGVDFVVWETGLGGRLDATNVIEKPLVSLVTPIGMDHQDYLGDRLEEIAGEKAGILKPGCPAATLQTEPKALQVLRKRAAEVGSRLWVAGEDFKFSGSVEGFTWKAPGIGRAYRLPGRPAWDMKNASLALAGLRLLELQGIGINWDRVPAGLSRMKWPGRFEEVRGNPRVVLDGGHNPQAAEALVDALERRYPGKKWIMLNGFLRDKDYRTFIRKLAPLTRLAVVTEPVSPRAEGGSRVVEAWEKAGIRSLWFWNWKEALDFSLGRAYPGCGLLVCGSFYLVGACREKLLGREFLENI